MREHTTFASFWPYYLREHSKPRTRALHYIGTTLVIAVALYAIVTGSWLWLLPMPVAGLCLRLDRALARREKPPGNLHLPVLVAGRRFPNVRAVAYWSARPRIETRRRSGASIAWLQKPHDNRQAVAYTLVHIPGESLLLAGIESGQSATR